MRRKHLARLLCMGLCVLLLWLPSVALAQQAAWLSGPPTSPLARVLCPGAGQWLMLYWGGTPVPISQATHACADADSFWARQGEHWLGFSKANPAGSDTWTVQTGQAIFLHRPPMATVAVVGSTALPTPLATPIATPTAVAVTPTPGAPAAVASSEVRPGGDQPIGWQTLPPVIGMPENVNVSAEFLGLKETLAAHIAAYQQQVGSIDVGIAVTDLQTGETISVNGNVLHRTGCTINLFALLAAVSEFEAGRADPRPLAADIRIGIGSSSPPEVARFLTAIFGSHQRGVERARELMRSWGLKDSVFDHVPYYGDGTRNNLLTALETNLALTKLYRGELFSPEWTEYTFGRLLEIKPGLNYILPGQLPGWATVAHKIGYYADLDGWVNADAGVVAFADAEGKQTAYAITYLSDKAPTEAIGYMLGARLSHIAWDYFVAKYGTAL